MTAPEFMMSLADGGAFAPLRIAADTAPFFTGESSTARGMPSARRLAGTGGRPACRAGRRQRSQSTDPQRLQMLRRNADNVLQSPCEGIAGPRV